MKAANTTGAWIMSFGLNTGTEFGDVGQ